MYLLAPFVGVPCEQALHMHVSGALNPTATFIFISLLHDEQLTFV